MEKPGSAVPQRLKVRKTPVQTRSGATVEAIHEAAIQVLLAEGLTRLTTTRVAERAGVSVGTLYQYFPNKEALLFALLQRHFEELASAMEGIGPDDAKQPLSILAEQIADTYVSVKIARPDATAALYRVAGAIDQFRLPADIYKRLEGSVLRILEKAGDASFNSPEQAAFTLLSALAGLSRGSFGNLTAGTIDPDRFRSEARMIATAYLTAAAQTKTKTVGDAQ